jgi:putative FmdB family regulatory protein
MPIYEFFCNKCKGIFETFVLRKDDAKRVQCPKCGGKKVKKMASSFSCGNKNHSFSGNSPLCQGGSGIGRRFG